MTLLPIVVRELRVASRRPGTYCARLGVVSVAMALGAVIWMNLPDIGQRNVGPAFISVMGYLGVVFSVLAATANTCDCISAEKREGTLGLLFLTDLKGIDVAFGKLATTSLNSFCPLLATVPVLAIAILAGGVSMGHLCLVTLAVMNAFFFSHSLGLYVSTFSRDRAAAGGNTLVAQLCWYIFLPILALILDEDRQTARSLLALMCSPVYAVELACEPRTSLAHFWQSLVTVNLIGWLFLKAAIWHLPRCWQDKPGKTGMTLGERWRQWWCYGPHEVRTRRRHELLDQGAFFWLVSRNRFDSRIIWGLVGMVSFLCVMAMIVTGRDGYMSSVITFVCLNHSLLKWGIAAEASRHLEEQRLNGGLGFVLSCTPLSVEEMLRGQWLALCQKFLRPALLVLTADLIFLILGLDLRQPDLGPGDKIQFAACMVAAMAILMADAFALGWLGMWLAMSQGKKGNGAIGAMLSICMLPWMIFGGLMSLIAFVAFLLGFEWEAPELLLPALWFAVGIVVDVLFVRWARRNLLARFRQLAAVQPEKAPGIMTRINRVFMRTGT